MDSAPEAPLSEAADALAPVPPDDPPAVRDFASDCAAFALAASEMRILFRTEVAPHDFAIRVIAPLCCITPVLPSMVATPFTTETVK